jgi:hypothetical protein
MKAMYHLKYYVFLLIGVFLALGLGMLIGITLENEDLLENQQIQLVRQIEDRFMALREETDALKTQLKSLELQKSEFENLSGMLLNEIARNRLNGMNIAIIDFTNGKYSRGIMEFIESTGASVTACIQFPKHGLETVDYDRLAAFSIADSTDAGTALAGDLTYSFTYGGKTPLLQELEDLGIIRNLKGYEDPADSIIVLSSGRNILTDKSVRYDLMIIDAASKMGFRIIAAEAVNTEQSLIPEYIPFGISTLDHADSFYGKLTLISLLTGSSGNYGYNASTQGIIPQPLFANAPGLANEEGILYEQGNGTE